MVRLAVIVVVVVVAGAGCALPVPFSVTRAAHVSLPLGPVGEGCDESLATAVAGFTFEHHVARDSCVMASSWHGEIIDMGDVRADAEKQVADQGAQLKDVVLSSVEMDVRRVSFTDLDGGGTIDPGEGLESMESHVDVLGQKDVLVVRAVPADGSDLADPDVTVDTSGALTGLIDDAFNAGDVVTGDGACEVSQSLDGLAPFTAASQPAVTLDVRIHVHGTAHAAL